MPKGRPKKTVNIKVTTSENLILKIKKLGPDAIMPTKAHSDDAGLDIYSAAKVRINGGAIGMVPTQIAVELPKNYRMIFADRSSVASIRKLVVVGGIIDPQYRGEFKVLLFNSNVEPVIIEKGEKIAQGLLEHNPTYVIMETKELSSSERGEKGFGSSN